MRVRIPDEGNAGRDGNDAGHTLGKCGRGQKGPPRGMAMGDKNCLGDSDLIHDRDYVFHYLGWSIAICGCRTIRAAVAAPIESDNAVVSSEVMNLAFPTAGVGDRRGWDEEQIGRAFAKNVVGDLDPVTLDESREIRIAGSHTRISWRGACSSTKSRMARFTSTGSRLCGQ